MFFLLTMGFALQSCLGAPTVMLDSATFSGNTVGRVSKFLGIPFAQPPVGDLRFRVPQPISAYNGSYAATSFGPACPQQAVHLPLPDGFPSNTVDIVTNSIYGVLFPDNEDCLTINVVNPTSAKLGSKLPVVVWIFGGGFQLGSTTIYDGGSIVEHSIQMGQPVVYVSMNYRLSGFGFMPGKEIKEAGAGNLGLQDQRLALKWVQKYISSFGGDPSKVTIWGESAGAISVSMHMITNGGDSEGLFRAGIMQSGSSIPTRSIEEGQRYYDAVVSQTGCSSAEDTLDCLRSVPYSRLKDAINRSPGIFSYQSLNLAWLPRVDGVFLKDYPQQLVLQGKVARIPLITGALAFFSLHHHLLTLSTGNCDDEGTLFSLSTLNITTNAQLKTYIRQVFFPSIEDSELDMLADLYPQDFTWGSPYSTGLLNGLTPQFKRMASLLGDAIFQAPRRFLLDNVSNKQDTWAFLSKRFKLLPFLGSLHTSDLLNSYGNGELKDYIIRFVNNLDPNPRVGFRWPKYDASSRQVLTFLDGLIPMTITKDDYRKDGMSLLSRISLTLLS
ncbi:hypothetical protein AMATHDRAFT_800 [Amanita thiersii Skay4041]|uniref:Carboxylic ester hydrolase n=1 Tax=Amanita thiersii Skay4041 TaxID=703135 RepID=A0A2A9NSP5_9AGAR|nr:hypothetical protein AMATHDRAFT_800 [Amanita thiersii Skay4041]